MFAFEFAVLTVLTLSTTARYGLSLYEAAVINHQIAQGRVRLQQNSGGSQEEEEVEEESSINMEIDTAGWEEKGLWIFYLDIATGTPCRPRCHEEPVLISERQTSLNWFFT